MMTATQEIMKRILFLLLKEEGMFTGGVAASSLLWRRLSGVFQVSELCSRGVWSLLHCYGCVCGWHLWGRRATAAHRHHCPSLQGDHSDRSFGVWNPFDIAMLGGLRDMKYSQPTSPQMWTHFCSWWCSSVCRMLLTMVRNSPHLPGTFSSPPTQGSSLTFSFSVLGFHPTPANHHASNCRT